CRVGRLYPNVPAARRPQVANARRKGRERIERFTELWQCQRLDVILQVGRLTARIRLGETSQLRWCHRHWPGTPNGVFERDHCLVPERLRALVERLHS